MTRIQDKRIGLHEVTDGRVALYVHYVNVPACAYLHLGGVAWVNLVAAVDKQAGRMLQHPPGLF